MASCINKLSPEYQTLVKRSGLSDFQVEAISRSFMDKYGRFPYLDELPNPNSELELKEFISLKENGGTTVENLLEATQTESVEEAIIDINDNFRDLEVSALQLGDEVLVNIEHRPNKHDLSEKEEIEPINEKPNSKILLNEVVNKLASLYGINIISTNSEELSQGEFKEIIPEAKTVNAFVYNGNVYINTDVASIDAPLHEMLHLLLGSLRFKNPELYTELISQAEQFPNYQHQMLFYKDRTRNDLNEEVFIKELANYLSGNDSVLSKLNDSMKYEIFYNINRILDTIFMGNKSVTNISKNDLFGMSLFELNEKLNSNLMSNQFSGTLDQLAIQRMESNRKSELLKSGELMEFCS